jgi:hypothetical protein
MIIIMNPRYTCVIIRKHPSSNTNSEDCFLRHRLKVEQCSETIPVYWSLSLKPQNSLTQYIPSLPSTEREIGNLKLLLQHLWIKEQCYVQLASLYASSAEVASAYISLVTLPLKSCCRKT